MSALDWADLCPQTIVWQPMVGRDPYGAPQYGPPQTFQGRRVYKLVRVPSRGGNADALSESTIWMLAVVPVGYEDEVYVAGDDPPYPIVLNVLTYPDENGDLFTKVMMGKAE